MATGRFAGQIQEELFAAAGCGDAEPVLMALNPEFYELIWRGQKTHEFRRRFLPDGAVRWFVYLNAPVSRLAAVIDLGPAIVDVPERIAAIAEAARPGNGASVVAYVRDLDRAFAIPILHVSEYPGVSADELRAQLGGFHPPQGMCGSLGTIRCWRCASGWRRRLWFVSGRCILGSSGAAAGLRVMFWR